MAQGEASLRLPALASSEDCCNTQAILHRLCVRRTLSHEGVPRVDIQTPAPWPVVHCVLHAHVAHLFAQSGEALQEILASVRLCTATNHAPHGDSSVGQRFF
eukprot:2216579-Amphidinium_carterae.1